MEPVVAAQRSSLLILLLFTLQALAQGDPSRSLTPAQPGKRTRNPWPAPRNRRKSIWSYNPGHRSLAFLVAGEVETITPNPDEIEATEEFRCLDCCGAVEMPVGGRITGERPGERRGQSQLSIEEVERIEIESNVISDRCLGCCDGYGTPLPAHIGSTGVTNPQGGSTAGVAKGGGVKVTPSNQPSHPIQTQRNYPNPCVRPPCRPDLSSESDSSSEESPGGRRSRAMRHHRTGSRSQSLQQSRTQNLCRYLGCRSPLGNYGSSSSEED
ncbi:uncharacterized protein XB22065625.S [Xenopus laevis]|uniref:Uncharacterized protein n=2 Tax=Xenopus laevis TaxID=8355 RepID=A0A974HDB1_XENLA|nr:uncharacterized protein XB22065625.S [Xenopus laevis]OCT73743.1 hypothetical protein XELAEV_18032707mg [Xenopus laevis]